jgi:hypothetical protein
VPRLQAPFILLLILGKPRSLLRKGGSHIIGFVPLIWALGRILHCDYDAVRNWFSVETLPTVVWYQRGNKIHARSSGQSYASIPSDRA